MRCLASKKNIQNLLYATLFLLPLHPYVFYVTLLPCLLLGSESLHHRRSEMRAPSPLGTAGGLFGVCLFLRL